MRSPLTFPFLSSILPIPSSFRRRLGLLGLVSVASLACAEAEGQPGATPATDARTERPRSQAAVRTLGTLEGMVDDETRTWYVVAGEAQDGPYSSGVWFELSEGVRVISLGGFDTPEPPVHAFDRGGGNPTSMSLGGYEGSTLNLTLEVPGNGGSTRFSLPEEEARNVAVVFMPVFDLSDMSGMYRLVRGTLEVETAEIRGRTASVRGTFSGRLETSSGADALEITDGRFRVEGIPHQDAVKPR